MSLEFEKSPLDKSADFRIRLNALPVQIVFDVVSCTVLSDTVHTLHGTVNDWISQVYMTILYASSILEEMYV